MRQSPSGWSIEAGSRRRSASLLRIGTGDWFLHESGEQDYARERYGLTVEAITERVMGAVRAGSPVQAI